MNRSKKTQRFDFRVRTNTKSHLTGANTVSISVKDYPTYTKKGYSTPVGDVQPEQTLTMTVKEALAFQRFLNECFPPSNG